MGENREEKDSLIGLSGSLGGSDAAIVARLLPAAAISVAVFGRMFP